MALKLTNTTSLPGVLAGALAPLKKSFPLADGAVLFPGFAAYFWDKAGATVGPPRNNQTLIEFNTAPSSGDTLTVVINGVTVTQAWDTDAATTMAALAVKLAAEPNIASATVQDTNKDILIVADAGYECVVTSVANSDGTTTDTITPSTTDTFAGIVVRDRREQNGADVLKYEFPAMVSVLVDGDAVMCGIGGISGNTYDIDSDVYVRLNADDAALGEYPGQIMPSAGIESGRAVATVQSALSFDGSGVLNSYNYVAVTKGA